MKQVVYQTFISICALLSALSPLQVANAQYRVESLQEYAHSLTETQVLSQALVGICVRTGEGELLASVNADKMLLPASNMKLLTTGAALHSLGSDFQFETTLSHTGCISDGILKGDLYIVGGGDPTLAAEDSIAVERDILFKHWLKILKDAGIRKIDGKIVGDGRLFGKVMEESSWFWDDLGTYYGAGTSGLNYHDNMVSVTVAPGKAPGDDLEISSPKPPTPWMEIEYDCTTGAEGTGDQLYLFTSDLAPKAVLRGTLACNLSRKRVDLCNKFPEYTCADAFATFLEHHGIHNNGAADFKLKPVAEPTPELKPLGSTLSPALSRIAFEVNHISDNVYAESIFRTLGLEQSGSACYDSSRVALVSILQNDLGLKTTKGLSVRDGSGLSRLNLVSPDFFCRFLMAMMDSPAFDGFLSSLPYPGGPGTTRYNLQGISESDRMRIRVKSGSMGGVRCYSGYVLPKGDGCRDKAMVFSIMVNNCTAPNYLLRRSLDGFLQRLLQTDLE